MGKRGSLGMLFGGSEASNLAENGSSQTKREDERRRAGDVSNMMMERETRMKYFLHK